MEEVGEWINNMAGFNEDRFWTGGRDLEGSDEMAWVTGDGTVIASELWEVGQPDHANGNCVHLKMLLIGPYLAIMDCSAELYAICKA